MQLHDLFEGNEQAYNWHSEPEQRNIDATRQARLYREREPEGSEAIDARLRARYDQLDQYNQSGRFWLKQKDTQEHISDAMIGKAAANAAAVELLKQRPELKGNLVITAYGPGESQGVAEGEKSPMAKDAQRTDRIRSLKNLISIAREQGRQLRVQELELELKKLQGVTEMDSQGYTGTRDRKKTSKYGSRDHYNLGGPESTGRPLTAKQMMDRAHKAMLKSMSNDEKVDKGWRNPNIDEGTEQVYNILALDKGNALKKPTKLKWKASSLEDIFDALAAQDWYPLEINGVEVIAGKRLKQGVAEGAGNIGSAIKSLYRKIYRAGDDEIEYFYNASPIFAQYWDEYEGDLDSIIAEVDPEELAVIKAELESYAQDANLAEAPGAETLSHNQSTVSKNLNSLDLGEGDISQLEKDIAAAPVAPIANMEADEKIGGRHDPDDFDAMVGRLKKLAGAGPMKTVYDPNKRVYRNVPTAVQPAQQPKK